METTRISNPAILKFLVVAALALAVALSANAKALGAGEEPGKDDTSEIAGAQSGPVTFTKDVAPIFQRSCQKCHRPGLLAPMALLTYEDARPWAKSIRERVSTRSMPPWHIDRSVGEYYPDPSLSDEEIQKIVQWVDTGSPRGNPADMPPPIVFPSLEEWQFGEPDLVVTMPEEYVVPPEGKDTFPNFRFPSGLTEDRYIKWIEVKPSRDGRKSIHHIIVYAIQDDIEYVGEDRIEGDDDPTRVGRDGQRLGSLLIEYAVGNNGDIYADGTGKLLMAGAEIRFGSHYHSVGEDIRDRTSVAFGFYPVGYVPKHRVISTRIYAGIPGSRRLNQLNIPPNDPNVRHDGYRRLPRPTKLLSFQAHMHYRGKAMELEAIHLDGRRELLTNVQNYDFNWQVAYPYKNPPIFPTGTVLHVTSYHDNSAANPYNPDPDVWVHWGSTTEDEMAIGWTNFVYISDEEYEEYLRESSGG